jgi:hypothetical protein
MMADINILDCNQNIFGINSEQRKNQFYYSMQTVQAFTVLLMPFSRTCVIFEWFRKTVIPFAFCFHASK